MADISQVEEKPSENMSVEVNPAGANQCQVEVTETSVKKTAPVGCESIPLNFQELVEEHPSLTYALKMATCVREARDMPIGYFVRDGILLQIKRPGASFIKLCLGKITTGGLRRKHRKCVHTKTS